MQPSDEDDFSLGKEAYDDVGRGHVAAELDENIEQVREDSDGVSDRQGSKIDPFASHQRCGSFMGGGKPHHQPERQDVETRKPKQGINEGDHVRGHPSP